MIAQPALLPGLLNGFWLFAIFVVGPLLSLLAVSFALMISSRVTDPRAAEQLSTVVILPLILIIVGQSIGLFTIDQQAVFIFAGILVILDIGLLYLASQVFQRENILVKWK
jgi:ABC-2 type transport system permease protein